MLRGAIVAAAAGVFIVAACSSFGGDASSGATDSSDGGGADGSIPPVNGTPVAPGPLGLALAGPVRITTGGTATVKVTLNASSFKGSVHITATGLPKGIAAPELVITSPSGEGELRLTAAGDVVQGPVSGVTISGVAPGGVMDGAALDLFVRGPTGSLDTTYATGGSMDLGVSTYAQPRRYPKYLFVGTGNGGLRRFAPDGTLDTAFVAPPAGKQFSMASDESVFAWDASYLRHYSRTGVMDPNFAPLKLDAAQWQNPQIGPNPAGDLVIVADTSFQSPQTFTVSATGVMSTPAALAPAGPSVNIVTVMEAQADGTFLVGMGGGSRLRLLRLKPDATVDTTFSVMGVSDVTIPAAATGFASIYRFVKTGDGTYVVGGSYNGLFLFRENNNGGADASFGDGTVLAATQLTTSVATGGLDVDSMGRPLVAYSFYPDGTAVSVSRYTKKGAIDASFASGGSVTLDFGTTARLWGFFLVDDERALIVFTHDGDAFIQRIWL